MHLHHRRLKKVFQSVCMVSGSYLPEFADADFAIDSHEIKQNVTDIHITGF